MPTLFDALIVAVSFIAGLSGPLIIFWCMAGNLVCQLLSRNEFCYRAFGWHYHGQRQQRPDGAPVFVIVMEPDDGYQSPEALRPKPEENAA